MKLTAVLRRAVWNGHERRPTALVRLVAGAAVTLLVLFAVQVVFAGLALAAGSPLLLLVVTAVLGVTVLVVGVGVDRRTVADLGFGFDRGWWVDFGFGLALGAVLMTAILLVSLAAGWASVTGTFVVDGTGFFPAFLPSIAFVTALFLLVGFQEELIVRGWVLTNLAEGFEGYVGETGAVGIAVALSSVLFGALHLGNPNATAVSALGITLAGVMLATGYVLTGDLAIPVGLHITWNLFQGAVYGFPVSGLDIGVSVVALSVGGPQLVTGGPFGPEAGLLGVGGVVAGTALTAAWVRWRTDRLAVVPTLTVPDLRWRRGEATAGPTTETPGEG